MTTPVLTTIPSFQKESPGEYIVSVLNVEIGLLILFLTAIFLHFNIIGSIPLSANFLELVAYTNVEVSTPGSKPIYTDEIGIKCIVDCSEYS